MKKTIFITLFASFNFCYAQNCDVVQVISKDSVTNQTRRGNGFAYTAKYIVVNDHTLAADAQTVQLKGRSENYTARVIKRDFHTDLAVLEINGKSFTPCTLQVASDTKAVVTGYDQRDTDISSLPVLIKTKESTKLMVPGILKSLEIAASGNSELRSSQSGSILTVGNNVVGFVTQKTQEGTALAIPAEEVDKTVRLMLQNQLPKRNYEVDRRQNTFRFDGLKIERQGIIGGINPHEANKPVNPHEGSIQNPYSNNSKLPQPIALEDYDVGAVLATVEDFSLLIQKQPSLAKALREAHVNKVFISMIDGIKIKHTMELLRVLGECTVCKIESFWIDVKNPDLIKDTTLKTMGWLSALILELEINNPQEKVRIIVNAIQELNPYLAKILTDSQNSKIDLPTKQVVKEKWLTIEKQLDKLWHSERTLDILGEIRTELL